jgi:stearoyl-CoA desaturase (delta-9 desaturase)
VTWRDLVIFAVGYALTTLGISIGFHRLFTHRSYETFKAIRYGSPCSARWPSRDP